MSEAPERIWAQHDTAAHMDTLREMAVKPVDEVAQAFTPYLRADLAKAAEAAAYERAVGLLDADIKKIQPEMTRRAQRLAAQKKPGFNYAIHRADLDARMSCRDKIRAMIDPDAASALDAVRAEVRRECAEMARGMAAKRRAEAGSSIDDTREYEADFGETIADALTNAGQ